MTKPKIDPSGTYVLDEEDIEQLDQASLTSVVKALAEAVPKDDPEPTSSGIAAPAAGDTTINKMLEAVDDQALEQAGVPTEPDPADDLITPDLVFPELTPRPRR